MITAQYKNNILFGARVGTPKNLGADIEEAVLRGEISQHFVPTPDAVIDLMIKEVGGISHGDRILEPSAGFGHIVDRVCEKSSGTRFHVDAVESVDKLRDVLSKKGVTLVGKDILAYKPGVIYDKILMNPPFDNGADILHTLHCYNLLKPGGKMAVVLPESSFLPTGTEAGRKWKRDWLGDGRQKEINEYLQDLLAQSGVRSKNISLGQAFFESDIPDDINSRLLIIQKPRSLSPDASYYSKKLGFSLTQAETCA